MVNKVGKVIDNRKCIGCHACTTACKMEHDVPLGVTRTYVKQVDVGVYPQVSRHFQVTRCNQCENPPCVEICPVSAMYQRRDGIVDFDRQACIGCKACILACPYDAIYLDPESRSAEKCNFCAHRVDQGLAPACVIVCPVEAIVVGDLADPESNVSQLVARNKTEVRKPEKGTLPKLYYVEASQHTLIPTASLIRKEQHVPAQPATHASQQQNPANPPWDLRVSAYTFTKSIAAGCAGLPAVVGCNEPLTALTVALLMLALTGGLLLADLSHPERFLNLFLRPQLRSWLSRGAFVLLVFGVVLAADIALLMLAADVLASQLSWLLVPLSALAAVYTAFLFAQAKGRDLFQNAALPLHLLIQAALGGAATLLLVGGAGHEAALRWILLGALGLHLVLVGSDVVIPHPIEDAQRAVSQMTTGRYKRVFWTSVGTAVAAAFLLAFAPALLIPGAVLALLALATYEHAYVQAAQSVPLS